jgi:hypothetical protein
MGVSAQFAEGSEREFCSLLGLVLAHDLAFSASWPSLLDASDSGCACPVFQSFASQSSLLSAPREVIMTSGPL